MNQRTMQYRGMLINIPSKEETITFLHVKANSIVMFHRRLSGYFFNCFQLGSSFPVTHLGSRVTRWNEIRPTSFSLLQNLLRHKTAQLTFTINFIQPNWNATLHFILNALFGQLVLFNYWPELVQVHSFSI